MRNYTETDKSLAIELIKENRENYKIGCSPERLAKLYVEAIGSQQNPQVSIAHELVAQIREDLGEDSVLTVGLTYIVPEADDEQLIREFFSHRVQYGGTIIRRTKNTLYVAGNKLNNEDFVLAADIISNGERVLTLGLRKIST